jgi:hypothetical protein
MNHQIVFLNKLHHALGTPYVWGGSAPGGFDCSGLIYWAAKMAGIRGVPRTSQEQYNYGRPVAVNHLRPGDLVFTEPGPTGPGHVGIYLGNGRVESAPHTGAVVHITSLTGFGTLVGARRILAHPGGQVVQAGHYATPKGQMPPNVPILPHVQPQFQNPALGARQALGGALPTLPGATPPATPGAPLPTGPAQPTVPNLQPLQTLHDDLLRQTA